MKRKTLVLGIISIFIVSCSLETEKQYTLFTPSNESYFRVTFEYPSDWKWEILDGNPNVVSAIIKTSDQTQKIQTPNPAICHNEANISAVVALDKNPQKVLDAEKNAIKYGVDVTKVVKIKSQEEFEINGFPAIKIIMKDEPLSIDPFAHCISEIDITTIYFLMTSDRLYKFTFSASENEQDTEFYRNFIHLVGTINVVP